VSSVKRPASCVSRFSNADDPILNDQRIASSERTFGAPEMYSGCCDTSSTRMASPPLCGQPGHTLANLDPDPLGDFARISHLEADSQVLCLLIHQQDGERSRSSMTLRAPVSATRRSVVSRSRVVLDDVRHLEQQGLDLQAVRIESEQLPTSLGSFKRFSMITGHAEKNVGRERPRSCGWGSN